MKHAAYACASTRTARTPSFSCIILTAASASSELAAPPDCRSRRPEPGPGSCAGSLTRAATQWAMSATAAGSRRSRNSSDTPPSTCRRKFNYLPSRSNNPSKLHRQLRGRILRALNLSAYPSLIFEGCEAAAFPRPGPSRTRPRASSSGIVPVKHCLTSITTRSPAADPRRSCSQRTRPGGSRPNFAELPDLLRKP